MSDEVTTPDTNQKRNKTLIGLTIVIFSLALIWFLLWVFYLRFYESTDDAYVNGSLVNVTGVVPGTPIAFFADNTDFVAQGELLVSLDPTDYKIAYEKELKTLATTALQVQQLYEDVQVAEASVARALAVLDNARYDFDNRHQLVGIEAVSNEDFVHAKYGVQIAEADLKKAQQEWTRALAAAGTTPPHLHPLIEAQKNAVRSAFYRLQHCQIYAPISGYIAQRVVEVGQWSSAGKPLMAIIPQDYMWIDANFKETQLANMRIGQPATAQVDLYGNAVTFQGKVLGIASGTGSVFSAIPPQNATGNWIKIVQRLAVRIGLDSKQLAEFPLRLGLSSYVTVDIARSDLPTLAEIPKTKPVATTDVFSIDFGEVEQVMQAIVQQNLFSPQSR